MTTSDLKSLDALAFAASILAVALLVKREVTAMSNAQNRNAVQCESTAICNEITDKRTVYGGLIR